MYIKLKLNKNKIGVLIIKSVKEYVSPVSEILMFRPEDIITTSGLGWNNNGNGNGNGNWKPEKAGRPGKGNKF